MTLSQFVEMYSGAPFDTEEIARIASDVEGVLEQKAQSYLAALQDFLDLLDEIGFVWG